MDFTGPLWTAEQNGILGRLEDAMEASRRDPVARLIRVEGSSRTGKSALIMWMALRVQSFFDHPEAALVVAFTNASAAAVKGRTVHRAFALPWEGKPEPLADWDRERLAVVRVVLIDDANLLPRHLLKGVDKRLREVVGDNKTPFGGRIVVAFGDHDSWGPVPYESGMRPSVSKTWEQFITIELEQAFIEEASFRRALRRLGAEDVNYKDVSRFEARRLSHLSSAERRRFHDSPKIIVKAVDADSYNERRRLQEKGKLPPSTVVKQVRMAMDPSRTVDLWEGAKVLVTTTLPGDAIAVAGDLGVVTALKLSPTGSLDAAKVLLEEDREILIVRDEDDETIPLAPAYTASTLPKAMGLHYTRVLVQLPESGWGKVEFLYGAVSRARGWSGLAFAGDQFYWDA